MSEDDKQTVADETNGQPTEVVSEENGAPEQEDSVDLDALLAEFKQGTESTQPEQKAAPQETNGVSREEFETLNRQIAQQNERDALNRVIPEIRGDMDHFKDKFVETWLRMKATEDPRVDAAWANRDKDPAKFAKVVSGLGREFAKEYGKLSSKDEKATADREAVAQAVRGHGNPAPEGTAPSYGSASNNDFRDDVKKRYGFNVPI